MNAPVKPVSYILTPEHVPIELVPAGLGSRFTALLADTAVIGGLVGITEMILRSLTPFGLGLAFSATLGFAITWGYHVFFDVYRQGRTFGKKVCGLRVVDARGLPVTVEQSMVRNILRVIDFAPIFYALGGIFCLLGPRHRRVGDLIADTLVIREWQPEAEGKRFARQRRFNSLEDPRVVRRVRQLVGLEEREFLLSLCLRSERLSDEARFDLFGQIGGYYRDRLQIDNPHLSDENLVRDLTALLYGG